MTSLAVATAMAPRWCHSRGFGLRTAGPVFIFAFQAGTPVSEGHQVNKAGVAFFSHWNFIDTGKKSENDTKKNPNPGKKKYADGKSEGR